MAEDWRVTVSLNDARESARLLAALHAGEVGAGVHAPLDARIAVSGSDGHVFLYASSGRVASEAEKGVAALLAAQGLEGELRLDRWHHVEEEWEDAALPLPASAAERAAEHERLEQREAAESEATGLAAWELRIELASHHDARALEERLEHEGFGHLVRRWRYVLVGTAAEDDAHALARRLKGELPAGATIHVEPGGGLVWQVVPQNPYAVFGGLGS